MVFSNLIGSGKIRTANQSTRNLIGSSPGADFKELSNYIGT